MYDMMLATWCENTTIAKRCYVFSFNGNEVCTRTWYEIHGVPKTSFYCYHEQLENWICQSMHVNDGVIRKERDHTKMGRALMLFCRGKLERIPHKSRTMEDGTRKILLAIPNAYN